MVGREAPGHAAALIAATELLIVATFAEATRILPHMRRGVCGVAVAAALILTAGASATESTIYPGVGIGKIKLGMTLSQVEHVFGRDYIVDARSPDYLELGWNYATWAVGFQRGRAVLVSTTLHTQRTTAGAGPGAPWLKVVHAYPGGRCTFNGLSYHWRLEYLVPHRGGTQSLFVFREVYDETQGRVTGYEAVEATVRKPFKPLPEFASGWRWPCLEGWAKTELPQHRQ